MEAEPAVTPPIAIIRDEELLQKASKHEYATHDGQPLHLYVFPAEGTPNNELPKSAIILFHGGNWDQSMVTQFAPQAVNFASLGMLAIVAEYRCSDKFESTPSEAIQDAQTAILWLRQNHSTLGLDPEKIIAGGSGSGAHIALCAALHKHVQHDESFTARPNGLILWSAIVDTTKYGNGHERFNNKREAKLTSPSKNLRRKGPPMIFFHGNEDPFIPVQQVERFCNKLARKKNDVRFVPYNRATHSFFNFNVNQHYFISTLEAAESFLSYHRFIEEQKEASPIDPLTFRSQPRH